MTHRATRSPWWATLWVQVLGGVLLGALLGGVEPAVGVAMKPLGDAFVALIKMLVGPVVFCTLVHGIGSVRDLRQVGRVGLKALIYFELVSTLALVLGLLAGHVLQPGSAFGGVVPSVASKAVEGYVDTAAHRSVVDHLLGIIPTTFVDAFAKGDLLQVLLVSLLTGIAVGQLGTRGRGVTRAVELAGKVIFGIVEIVIRLAPVGAFGAMAYTVGAFGAKALVSLMALVGSFYATALVFVFVVLGLVCRLAGFSLWRFLRHIREELVLVLGTSSSETALPGLMRKLEGLGAKESVVGLVVPTGYSFNLDGTNIYMSLAVIFLAQVTGTQLSLEQEITLVLVAMLTSKGASGVTGAGFVVLAATLTTIPDIPVASLSLLLGVDRFMSQCRALTNLVGNGVATLVVARWDRALDRSVLRRQLERGPLETHQL